MLGLIFKGNIWIYPGFFIILYKDWLTGYNQLFKRIKQILYTREISAGRWGRQSSTVSLLLWSE